MIILEYEWFGLELRVHGQNVQCELVKKKLELRKPSAGQEPRRSVKSP